MDPRSFCNSLAAADTEARIGIGIATKRPTSRYIVTLRHAPAGPEEPKCSTDSPDDYDFVAMLAVQAHTAAEACSDAIRRHQAVTPFIPLVATIVR